MERYREEIPANRPGEQNNVCVGERERERVGADDPLEEKSRWVDEKQQIWEAEEGWWEILTLSSKDLKPFNASNTHTHTHAGSLVCERVAGRSMQLIFQQQTKYLWCSEVNYSGLLQALQPVETFKDQLHH